MPVATVPSPQSMDATCVSMAASVKVALSTTLEPSVDAWSAPAATTAAACTSTVSVSLAVAPSSSVTVTVTVNRPSVA